MIVGSREMNYLMELSATSENGWEPPLESVSVISFDIDCAIC